MAIASCSLPVTRDKAAKPLFTLDQTYIIFDIDRKGDASEVIHISKVPRIQKIAFRFQVRIILYGNRYNPNHLLLVQAVEAQGCEDRKTESRKVQHGISRVLRLSRKVGAAKVRELESLLEMLKGDEEILKNNVDQTMKLKSIIKAQLEQRKKSTAELTTRLGEIEGECDALNRKIREEQSELQKIYDNFRLPIPTTT